MQIGEIIDGLGIDVPLDDDDTPVSAIVILTFFSQDQPQQRMYVAESEGLSWIEKAGLLRLAECADAPSYMRTQDDD